MIELVFIMFVLVAHFFHFLGIITFTLIVSWITYVAYHKSGYRLFCSSWWQANLNWYTYWYEINHYYQRLRYGISHSDCWSFDTHLLKVMIWGLKDLKNAGGFAPNLEDDEWATIINGLENYHHTYDCGDVECYLSDRHGFIEDDFSKAMQLITKHFKGLWI